MNRQISTLTSLSLLMMSAGISAPRASLAAAVTSTNAIPVLFTRPAVVGFYNEGTDFPDHEDADEAELARHRAHPMSPAAVRMEDRARLTELLSGEVTALRPSSLEVIDAAQRHAIERELLSGKSVSWINSTAARSIHELLKPGVPAVSILQIREVSHGTGQFIRPKAMAHYFCVDVAARSRVALPDGRLLPVHTTRVCKCELFHPNHREGLDELENRQKASLRYALDRLLRMEQQDLRRVRK